MKKYNQIINQNEKQYLVFENLEKGVESIQYMKSGWGNEYRLVNEQFGRHFMIEETLGRSSATVHPFITLNFIDGSIQKIVIGYSGNWKIEIEKTTRDTLLKVSIEGETISPNYYIPTVYVLEEKENVIDLYEKKKSDEHLKRFPISYNHWWSYEDQNINEKVVIENTQIAKKMGVEYVVLDAGWFGSDDEWMNIRGDWSKENNNKFPSGIVDLSEKIRQMGLKFGIWVEIEAIGKNAKLRDEYNQYIAEVNGEKIDLLCFGNKRVQEFAYQTVKSMIVKYSVSWIKMDFNIDPKSGCTSKNHDHSEFDGNQAHVDGLYKVIKRLKLEFEDVIFENCSSGGQRSDQKIIDLFDVNFLSDADYIEHKTRCFKNSLNLIPNYKNYHFIPSMTLTDYDSGFRSTDFRKMNSGEINYNLVTALYGLTGISHRLVEYNQEILDVMITFFEAYNKYKYQFISNNQPVFVSEKNFDLIYYQVGKDKLVGVMAHNSCHIEFEEALDIIDLLEDEHLEKKIRLETREGKLLLVKGE